MKQPEENKIGDPSSEAIDHAKRLIALKWTKETNVYIIAGTWQAGYVAAQIDYASCPYEQEVKRLRYALETLRHGIFESEQAVNDFIDEALNQQS